MVGNISKINENSELYLIKNDIFYCVNFYGNKIIDEGWKVHVSAFFNNYKRIFNIVHKYLIKNKIAFKWIYDEKEYFRTLYKQASRISAGKFITIYPKNNVY